jgi:hypothetical protein
MASHTKGESWRGNDDRRPPSHQITRHPLNVRHVVVKNRLLAAIIPFDGYARPILFSDGALIGLIVLPANTFANY